MKHTRSVSALSLAVGSSLIVSAIALFPRPACAVASASQIHETRRGMNGSTEVRTVTAGPGIATPGGADAGLAAPDPATPGASAPAFPSPAGTRDGGTILWVDRNHLNAIAENVAISGDAAFGIAGWWLNNKRVALYQINQDNIPEWTHPMLAAFQIPVDADLAAERLLATGRGDSVYVFASATSDPIYSDWYTPPLQGYECAVSVSGNTYAAGGGNPDGSAGEVRVYDGSGALRFIRTLPAPPEGVNVSADGLLAVANVRGFAKVWDALTGALRDSIPIPGETQTPAVLSGDGGYLATGGFSRTARLYQWNGTDYAPVWSYNISGTTWITALAMSDDGSTLVAGTWTNPSGGKVVVFSTASSTPLWDDSSFGDEVQTVAISPDGARIAAASWGRYGGTAGNILSVYDRASSTPAFGVADDQLTGVGSAMGVDISRDGQVVFAGGKAVHAREFGNGGWTMALYVPGAASVDRPSSIASDLLARPNPSSGPVHLLLGPTSASDPREILIVAADGRRIRHERLAPGTSAWLWDGRDQAGRRVAPGAYFARVLTRNAEGGNGSLLIRVN